MFSSSEFMFQEKEVVKLVHNGSPGHETVVSCTDPIELMSNLLLQLGGAATLDQLCQVMPLLIEIILNSTIVDGFNL